MITPEQMLEQKKQETGEDSSSSSAENIIEPRPKQEDEISCSSIKSSSLSNLDKSPVRQRSLDLKIADSDDEASEQEDEKTDSIPL